MPHFVRPRCCPQPLLLQAEVPLGGTVGVIPAYVYRITVEERMLREEIGQPYADYAARTRRLIPNVW